MPLSTPEEELYEWIKASLPRFFSQLDEAPQELPKAFVKLYMAIRSHSLYWNEETFITHADGLWLDQHARDRGTFRQSGEDDTSLAIRLRTIEDALTRPVLEDIIQGVLDRAGVTDPFAIVELRRERAFFNTLTPPSGQGDVFTKDGDVITLTDAGYTFTGHEIGRQLTITSSISNDGTFEITAVGDHSLSWVNASGGDEPYTGFWFIDQDLVNRKAAYLSRGYRMGSNQTTIITIFPYGTTTETANIALDAIRRIKGAGVQVIYEIRAIP